MGYLFSLLHLPALPLCPWLILIMKNIVSICVQLVGNWSLSERLLLKRAIVAHVQLGHVQCIQDNAQLCYFLENESLFSVVECCLFQTTILPQKVRTTACSLNSVPLLLSPSPFFLYSWKMLTRNPSSFSDSLQIVSLPLGTIQAEHSVCSACISWMNQVLHQFKYPILGH